MKSQEPCVDEDESDSESVYCWWRAAAKFDECARIRFDLPNVSSLTPRIRLFRELERLALIASDGLHELRQKLHGYRSGDFWVPTGGIKKEDMDIPPVNALLLVGFSGSGKSSLVNLMYSVLGRSGLIPFAQTSSGNCSNQTTMYLEEHNVSRSMRNGFCVYDSRGFNYDRPKEALDELSSWISEGVHHNQLCFRYGDFSLMTDEMANAVRTSSNFLQRRVNCVMVVVNMAEVYKAFKAADLKPLEATRQLFCSSALRKCNENPMLILTHGDLLPTEERIEARLVICECLGVSEINGVYDIVCLTEYGFLAEQSDPVSAYALTEAVYRALLISDRGHCPKKKLLDWVVLVLSWLMCFAGAFFAFLADICTKLGHTDHKLKR
ncbi:hypothetical protein SLE2022_332030 [Rubroshorea leprosula]